jgi:hypothetical protein
MNIFEQLYAWYQEVLEEEPDIILTDIYISTDKWHLYDEATTYLYDALSSEARDFVDQLGTEISVTELSLSSNRVVYLAFDSHYIFHFDLTSQCAHTWRTTTGLFSTWHDCEICGAKQEEVNSQAS